MEDYLIQITAKSKRSAFTKLRISDHRLEIEKDRYKKPKPPREERFCHHCLTLNSHVVGDELHFLLDCPKFETLRSPLFSLLPKRVLELDRVPQFVFIVNSCGEILQQAVNLIHNAFALL